MRLCVEPIGHIRSCYREKFGIPRQPGLVTEAKGTLQLAAEYSQQDSVRGLIDFSHIWLIFQFHATAKSAWKPTVRPPRLGGKRRVGVFATRSMFRPNSLGLSVVKLDDIQLTRAGTILLLSGLDLLDGTPVLDIKPYLPYADAIADAHAGFAAAQPAIATAEHAVEFSTEAVEQCAIQSQRHQVDVQQLIRQILAQDPRPAYRTAQQDDRQYGMRLYDFDVRWCYQADIIRVVALLEGNVDSFKSL